MLSAMYIKKLPYFLIGQIINIDLINKKTLVRFECLMRSYREQWN
ncbi:hypothetical protein XSR1_190020 [Xenorhabdus szentirmaii DSM 16338]|uniref:Uncharacterized protein n=1 Tax=Xenorhabdus szentirmaii DSM 16338 TaxID=1427518 RepID=W1IXZ1_9GAMM|nr:hypothetical protein XSR1_190020 [Xenorhabdus szentirmaii DSM 16338]